MAAKAKIVFSVAGAAAEAKEGNFGFFEGSYGGILAFILAKGLSRENIVGSIGHNGTNYYMFYWKP